MPKPHASTPLTLKIASPSTGKYITAGKGKRLQNLLTCTLNNHPTTGTLYVYGPAGHTFPKGTQGIITDLDGNAIGNASITKHRKALVLHFAGLVTEFKVNLRRKPALRDAIPA